MDAIDGFDTDYIENQKYPMDPFNNTFNIILNYQIIAQFLISGNYIIKIFSEGESNKPIANIKFFVSEQSSNVNFNIDESSDVEQSKYLQSYELECTYNSSNTIDPFSNIYKH